MTGRTTTTKVLFAGLDVSLEMTSICVVDADGRIVFEEKAVSDPTDISEAFPPVGAILRAGRLHREDMA
ncbi:hypothetical protein [Paralimibaculum aggregatum]|uniref:hypothetical protein n=1 Tax=Paralimibaculum aggregatum TaxID=3036245 RepID=UPI003DA0723D